MTADGFGRREGPPERLENLAERDLTIEGDYAGHETFRAVAPDTTVGVPTERLIEEFYPDTEIREMVGWEPSHSWRDFRSAGEDS